jgi:hypothetical protein
MRLQPDAFARQMPATTRQSIGRAREEPIPFEYEFFGPYGPVGVMVGLPVTCYALVALCNAHSCVSVSALRDGSWTTADLALPQPFATALGLAAVLAWCAVLVVLHLLLPGRLKQGVVLPDGTRLTYKLNGACITPCGSSRRLPLETILHDGLTGDCRGGACRRHVSGCGVCCGCVSRLRGA